MNRLLVLILAFITCCSIFLSCGTPSRIKKGLKYCYNGEYTGIDSLINTQGYYTMGLPYDKYGINAIFKHEIDTLYINYMFFKDGIYVRNFFDYDNNIPAYFKRIVDKTNNGKSDPFYRHFYWGRYIVCEDTIKGQYYHMPNGLNDFWGSGEEWFKIIDKGTLSFIPLKGKEQNPTILEKKVKEEFAYLDAVFIPVELLPSSNCKLKNKKWFWCNGIKIK